MDRKFLSVTVGGAEAVGHPSKRRRRIAARAPARTRPPLITLYIRSLHIRAALGAPDRDQLRRRRIRAAVGFRTKSSVTDGVREDLSFANVSPAS